MKAKNLTSISSLLLLLFLAVPVSPTQRYLDKSPPEGLPGVFVFMSPASALDLPEGITEDEIRSIIEDQLQEANVRVLTREEWSNTPGRPRLKVLTGISEYRKGGIIYFVDMRLIQEVLLAHNPNAKVEAATWRYGPVMGQAYCGDTPCPQYGIEGSIRRGVFKFIQSYKHANGK